METTNFLLNEQQRQAVEDTEGAVLVIAGAGSGKTRVLTARICHLIDSGVDPYNILAITFTNKAANEMKERILASTPYGSGVWTSTFHSMCAKMLRIDAERLGYNPNFSIYTDLESDRVVKRICAEYPACNPKEKAQYLWHISRAKTLGTAPGEYYALIKDADVNAEVIANIYSRYEAELKKSNAMDFDDLLLKTVDLFESCSDVLEKYGKRFRYIHVDEFQDTNTLQYKLVKLLARTNGNLFVVGDEDQSIYSWRGAEIQNILGFNKDFKDARIYKLEQNYRSTSSILNVANNVIKNNVARNEKNLWSETEAENSVEYYEAYSDRDEASYIARQINYLISAGSDYRDVAVLVRANSLTRLFEEEFNLHGIPYKVFGGFRFFERKEIKDVLAYVRLAINPSDNDSILRVINYPKRGIGNTAVQELASAAAERNTTFFSVLINPEYLSPSTAKKLSPFTQIAIDLVQEARTMKASEFIRFVINRSGIGNFLANSGDADDANRLENVEELVNAAVQFENDNPDLNINDFMQSVSLVSDTDEMDQDNYVSLATVHAVKGLEFDNVFIVGLEEGIFPTSRAIGSGDVEEERRLMYVAITRARRQVYATNARSRYRFGKTESFPKSRFVGEMRGEKKSVRIGNAMFAGDDSTSRFGAAVKNSSAAKKDFSRNVYGIKTGTFKAANNSNDINFDEFEKNTIVEHSKFGRGIIIQTSGEGEDKTASIAFKGLGVKRFSLAIAAPSLKIVKE